MKEIKLKSSNLVLQKYLEDPMLINGRKFDLRVFALLTPAMDAYVFETCYVRLSSEQMKLESKADLCNKYMHLTNNAIQELGKNYGLHEQGNIISVPQWEQLVRQAGGQLDFRSQVLPQIEECVRVSMLSCAELMNPNGRWHCFEVFGYDFMLDSKGKVWMIEINTNPSFSESNITVKTVIERMLDDAFKLTIDKIFIPKRQATNSKALSKVPRTDDPSHGQVDPPKLEGALANYPKQKSLNDSTLASKHQERYESGTLAGLTNSLVEQNPSSLGESTDILVSKTAGIGLVQSRSLKNQLLLTRERNVDPNEAKEESGARNSNQGPPSEFPLDQMPNDRNLW